MKILLKILIYSITLTGFAACQAQQSETSEQQIEKTSIINSDGMTIATRFQTPNGFTRVETVENTFANYLQNFPLYPQDRNVFLHNGILKPRQDVHAAVLKIDVGKRDLQQCADAIMRLRSEFLYAQKQYEKIQFNFTNGFKADYATWRSGKQISVSGNNVKWIKAAIDQTTEKAFRKYLTMVFSYAGTLSLAKEMKSQSIENIEIGDIFIQGGSPGHAVIIVDLAVNNTTNQKAVLLAQSYMPAQDIHVLKNMLYLQNPWYILDANSVNIETPEWQFNVKDLRKF